MGSGPHLTPARPENLPIGLVRCAALSVACINKGSRPEGASCPVVRSSDCEGLTVRVLHPKILSHPTPHCPILNRPTRLCPIEPRANPRPLRLRRQWPSDVQDAPLPRRVPLASALRSTATAQLTRGPAVSPVDRPASTTRRARQVHVRSTVRMLTAPAPTATVPATLVIVRWPTVQGDARRILCRISDQVRPVRCRRMPPPAPPPPRPPAPAQPSPSLPPPRPLFSCSAPPRKPGQAAAPGGAAPRPSSWGGGVDRTPPPARGVPAES